MAYRKTHFFTLNIFSIETFGVICNINWTLRR